MSSALTGSSSLLRALLKHEGRLFAPWIVIVTALSASSVILYPLIFPGAADRFQLAALMSANPAVGLLLGTPRGLTTVDGFAVWRSLALGGFLTALGAIFTVIRASRGQEDSGQAELLASGVLGRDSRLFSAVAMASLASLASGAVAGVVTALFGGQWESSLLLGATFAASGWMFAAVAAVCAQLGTDARISTSMSVATLGVLYLLRGFLETMSAPGWVQWMNPLTWIHETHPASGNHWWPLLLALLFAAVVLAVAFVLQSRRDFGQGLIAPRPGLARGTVTTLWRLALRLNRGQLIAWSIAFAGLGVEFGYFATSITDMLASNSIVRQLIGAGAITPADLVGAFLVTLMSMIGILAAVTGVQTLLRVRSEELEDRVEPIAATAVYRSNFFASNVLLALAASALYVLLAGIVIVVTTRGADIGVTAGHVLQQAVATIPAAWTVIAVAAAVVGARPQVSLAAWAGVLLSFALTLLGPTFKLPNRVLGISPFWHVPNVASDPASWSGLAWINLFTLGFLAIGSAGFNRRDLAR